MGLGGRYDQPAISDKLASLVGDDILVTKTILLEIVFMRTTFFLLQTGPSAPGV